MLRWLHISGLSCPWSMRCWKISFTADVLANIMYDSLITCGPLFCTIFFQNVTLMNRPACNLPTFQPFFNSIVVVTEMKCILFAIWFSLMYGLISVVCLFLDEWNKGLFSTSIRQAFFTWINARSYSFYLLFFGYQPGLHPSTQIYGPYHIHE